MKGRGCRIFCMVSFAAMYEYWIFVFYLLGSLAGNLCFPFSFFCLCPDFLFISHPQFWLRTHPNSLFFHLNSSLHSTPVQKRPAPSNNLDLYIIPRPLKILNQLGLEYKAFNTQFLVTSILSLYLVQGASSSRYDTTFEISNHLDWQVHKVSLRTE